MSRVDNRSLYPVTAIEENLSSIQQQPLIGQKIPLPHSLQPPTYEQATEEISPTVTNTATTGPTLMVVTEPPYGPHPIDVQCPYCHNFCRTRLRYTPSTRTHLIALLLCVFQLYCCVCLPYCIESCMNVNHYCGMCDQLLGTYQR